MDVGAARDTGMRVLSLDASLCLYRQSLCEYVKARLVLKWKNNEKPPFVAHIYADTPRRFLCPVHTSRRDATMRQSRRVESGICDDSVPRVAR